MFHAPHCPNPDCPNYRAPNRPDWYQKRGHYPTLTFGSVPRFRCKSCRRGFSAQTFSLDYFAKRRLDYRVIHNRINAGAGIRNIARDMNVKDAAITNRINRMARNALLANQMIVSILPFKEDLVIDGLQNFCVSQYYPDNYTILVGKDSQFVYDCDYATLRRAGRMTPDQKIRRAELEKYFRPSGKAIEHSFGRLLEVVRKGRRDEWSLILYTDEKKDYQRVLWGKKEYRSELFSGRWRHHMTNSKESRNQTNPLFPVNYLDREIRKDMASQCRETVQFPRNVSNAMLRMALYCFDHNLRKPYRIGNREKSKMRHAEVAGISRGVIDRVLKDFFTRRFFHRGDWKVSESARMTLDRSWLTPPKLKPEKLQKYLAA